MAATDATGRSIPLAQAMSRDHTPELEEEKQRVIQMGGEVRPLLFRGQGFGPPRVWVRGSNRPGLCMTRSFGDIGACGRRWECWSGTRL